MAIDDYKITNAEVQAAHVQAAPNTLTGTAQENKAVFDGYPELLKDKHNGLIDAIDDALSEKADSSDVEAALAEKADIDDVDTALAEKVDKIEGKGLSANDYIDADKALVGMVTNKVDKEAGKGLSTNDYTTAEKMKLSGIAAGAEVNVQADWEQSNSDADDYIKNKPYIPNKTSDLTNDSNYATETYVENGLDGKVDKETGKGLSANDYTSEEKAKLEDIEAGAEVNVQSDWSQNNSSADDYIKNKPTLPSKTSDLTNDSDYTTKQYVDGKLPIGKANGAIASVKDGADGMPMKSLVANIVPQQSGSGTPSPDNVREISGWESVETSVCGKNLLNPDYNAWVAGGSYLHLNGVVPKGIDAHLTLIDKDTSVSLSGIYFGWVYDDVTSSQANYYKWCINNGSLKSNTTNLSDNIDAVHKLCQNLFIYPNTEESFEKLFARYDIQVELGTSATEYTPYTAPTTHTTSLGRTVYGGTVDVVSGQLVDNMAIVDLGTLDWVMYSVGQGNLFRGQLSDVKYNPTVTTVPNLICEKYVTTSFNGRSNMTISQAVNLHVVDIIDDSYSDAAAFKTAMNGVQLCYELATPTTYQLTPQTINTLAGVNNVWADSGDCSIEYIRDIGLAFDNLLPDSPTTDGTYTLVCTVSDGKAIIAWQSSGASLSSPLSMSSPASLNSQITEGE